MASSVKERTTETMGTALSAGCTSKVGQGAPRTIAWAMSPSIMRLSAVRWLLPMTISPTPSCRATASTVAAIGPSRTSGLARTPAARSRAATAS